MAEKTGQMTKLHLNFFTASGVMIVAGLVLAALGMGSTGGDVAALPHAYLFGWVFWMCMTLGCYLLSLLHHAARGHWGFPVIRIFEAGGGASNLALFGAALIPILTMWKQVFYPWARPEEVAIDPVLQHRAGYFSDPALWIRMAIYFAVFIGLAYVNKKWLKNEERTGDEKWWKKRQSYGGVFLFAAVPCVNFFWTDVLMSQYPHWFSTIYGVWFVVGSALLAFSLVGIIVGTQAKKEPYKSVAQPWFLKDVGNWMLVFVMLWGYFSLSQYLIIWSGNLPEFIKYFLDRSNGGWMYLGWALIIVHFFAPFTMLLSPRAKRTPWMLAFIGIWIIAARFLDLTYVVTPTWNHTFSIKPLDVGMFFLFGGVWCALFGFNFTQAHPITHRIPQLKEATDHA